MGSFHCVHSHTLLPSIVSISMTIKHAWVYTLPNIGGAWPGLLWQLKRAWLQSLARMNNAALSHLGFVECRECEHRYSPCTYTHAWIVCSIPHKVCQHIIITTTLCMFCITFYLCSRDAEYFAMYTHCVYSCTAYYVLCGRVYGYVTNFWFEFSAGWLVGIAQARSPL